MSKDLIQELQEKAELYAKTPDGSWLNEFDWSSVPVTFKNDLPDYIAGYYSFGGIVLREADVASIFAIYVHELRHRWQRLKHPVRYLIGKIYRPLIENDADEQETLADYWFCEMADKKWEV